MTPDDLARIHRAAFTSDRPWRAREFADLLQSPHVALSDAAHGFALTRTVAGESELLTVAVDPAFQRRGIARQLLDSWLTAAKENAARAFLEVAADNHAAIALYHQLGFAEISRRRGYYARADAAPADALIMACDLTFGHAGDSA